jgi:ABC-type Fe3+-siderophore transport system permease subunit
MHLYTLVAALFIMQLLHGNSLADPQVKQYSAWIQAAFLIGWALGGAFLDASAISWAAARLSA